ncbi:MAG TPA: glycosyltransferase family 4 protein [Blastocatellia bacterium]
MRILWAKAGKLLPVDTGGKIRSYNILRGLQNRNDITLLSYYGGARDADYEQQIAEHFPGAVTIETGVPDSSAIDYLRRLANHAPYAVTKFTSPKVTRTIKALLAEDHFDVAICDFLSASLNFPRANCTPTVLFQHNVESALWNRQQNHEPNPARRIAFKIEAAKMLRYERAAVRRFDHVIAVSESDRQIMKTMIDESRISVVPTGVDLCKYQAATGTSARKPLVVFLGSMDWEANIDAVEYFCREIWPRVHSRAPGARFRIVGRNPHPRINRLASADIEVTGTVPSVIEHLREAAVVVVPLRVGGGTRLKIFEAMAMGKAVVSTSIGAEGLDVHHKRDILLADTAESFADCTIALLRDIELRERIEGAAAELAAQYDWSVIAERFEQILVRVADKLVGAALCGRPSPPARDAAEGDAATEAGVSRVAINA